MTKLEWHDAEKEKPKKGEDVLVEFLHPLYADKTVAHWTGREWEVDLVVGANKMLEVTIDYPVTRSAYIND